MIPDATRRALEEHAREEEPNEACGLVVLEHGVAVDYVRGRNAAASPYRFELEVDPETWFLEDEGYELAVFHSHPSSAAAPLAHGCRERGALAWPAVPDPRPAHRRAGRLADRPRRRRAAPARLVGNAPPASKPGGGHERTGADLSRTCARRAGARRRGSCCPPRSAVGDLRAAATADRAPNRRRAARSHPCRPPGTEAPPASRDGNPGCAGGVDRSARGLVPASTRCTAPGRRLEPPSPDGARPDHAASRRRSRTEAALPRPGLAIPSRRSARPWPSPPGDADCGNRHCAASRSKL